MRIKNSKQSSRSQLSYPKVFLVGAVCLLLWRAFFADHVTYVLEYSQSHTTDATGTMRDRPNFKPIYSTWPEKGYDHTLGPAVARAKYFGFLNRLSNEGHNRSDWEALTADKCEEQGAAEFLPLEEIRKRKLPMAIFIGVQKGGTTALYSYLVKHPDIEPSEKELYFLDEVLDNYLLNATHPSIPRNRGRELYSQMTLGIVQRLKRKNRKRDIEKQNNATGKGNTGKRSYRQTRLGDAARLNRKPRNRDIGNIEKQNNAAGKENTGKRSYAIVNTTEGGRRYFYVHHEQIENTTQDQRNEYMVQPNAKKSAYSTPDEDMHLMFKKRAQVKQGSNSITVDMTPNYMLHSDRVPARIQCLVPWVKLIVILRHPIDRARSHYKMKARRFVNLNSASPNSIFALVNKWGNPIRSFDQFVRDDLDALYELGVLQDWTKVKFEEFWKSEQCWKAWQTYIHSGLNAPVGMGLYALQLKPFLDVLRSMHGANATDYFFAIDNQELWKRPDETFQGLLEFLQLEPFSLENYKMTINQADGKTAIKEPPLELSPETLRLVQVAIEPYNQKLADLLGAEWRDKWSL